MNLPTKEHQDYQRIMDILPLIKRDIAKGHLPTVTTSAAEVANHLESNWKVLEPITRTCQVDGQPVLAEFRRGGFSKIVWTF